MTTNDTFNQTGNSIYKITIIIIGVLVAILCYFVIYMT